MGARISADVHAYVVPTSQSPAFTRDAHASHPSAYTIAAAATAVFGSELDSATARSSKLQRCRALPCPSLRTRGRQRLQDVHRPSRLPAASLLPAQ